MENASKALIIAGSIIITLMIIALGVLIFNKAQSAASTEELDTTEITMFNSKFERYADNQLGSQVKSLITYAISNASTNKEDPVKLPNVILNGISDDDNSTYTADGESENYINGSDNNNLTAIRRAIKSTHTYNVDISYGDTGLIDVITINW